MSTDVKKCDICKESHPASEMKRLRYSGTARYVCEACEGYTFTDPPTDKLYIMEDDDQYAGDAKTGRKLRFRRASWSQARSNFASLLVDADGLAPGEVRRTPLTKPVIFACNLCGQGVYAVDVIYSVASPHGRRIKPHVCEKCAATRRVLDCGCVIDAGEQAFTARRIQRDLPVDVDGVVEAESNLDEASQEMLDDGAVVCTQHMHTLLQRQQSTTLTDGNPIKQYSFTPTLVFHKAGNEDEPFMGFELEIDAGRERQECARQVLHNVGRHHVYLKQDGSLGSEGFEQVSHPATMSYIEQQRPRYRQLLEIPKAYGYTSHDAMTCGLHVHVDREFFPADVRDECIFKTLFIVEKFFPEVFIFSRRKKAEASKWAHRHLKAEEAAVMSASKLNELFKGKVNGDRRRVVNLEREPTMEFRIFRGTLNEETFFATLQLVTSIVKMARDLPIADLDTLEWRDVINYGNYPELKAYNAKRVGEAWNGETVVAARQVNDAGQVASVTEQLDIPDVIAKDRIKTFTALYLKGTNAALIEKVKAGALSSALCYIDAELAGQRVLIKERTPFEFVVVDDVIKYKLAGDEELLTLKWLLLNKAEVAEDFALVADRVIDAISFLK